MPPESIIAIVIIIFIMILSGVALWWYYSKEEDEEEDLPKYDSEQSKVPEPESEHIPYEVPEEPEHIPYEVPVQHEDNLIKPKNIVESCVPKCFWLSNKTNTWVDYSRVYPTKEACNRNDGPGGGLYKWDCNA